MPYNNEIKPSIINSLIAFLHGRKAEKAYIKHFTSNEDECPDKHNLLSILQDSSKIREAEQKILAWSKNRISIVDYFSELYPEKLKNIPSPPLILFCRGELTQLKKLEFSLAIVGSRKADTFGCEQAFKFAKFISAYNICVVSGLAYGIDTYAHKGAMEATNAFPTIAVLGNGLNSIYPKGNEKLAGNILEKGGLILSQFEPGASPLAHNFLDRNRIIAGLSDATLVIQAPQRSGALATARYALESSREVLSVPGAINDFRFEGSNRLIQSGAHMIINENDLLDFYPAAYSRHVLKNNDKPAYAFSNEQQKIIEILKTEPKVHIDKINGSYPGNSNVAEILLELEISGIIKQESGNFIRLIK